MNMKNHWLKYLLFSICLVGFVHIADAQKKGNRAAVKRQNTTVRKTAKGKTKAKVREAF